MADSVFNDIPDKAIQSTTDFYGQDLLDNVASLKIGSGAKAFKADESGIWLGANAFEDAPFSVDMSGNVVASTLNLSAYLSKAGEEQQLSGSIVINDGTNDIILIGLYPT